MASETLEHRTPNAGHSRHAVLRRRGPFVSGILVALVLDLSGCATLVSLLEPNSPKIYGGVRVTLAARALASRGETPRYGWTWYPFMLIDLPLSAIMDTAFLPVTMFLEPDDDRVEAPVGPADAEGVEGVGERTGSPADAGESESRNGAQERT